MAESDGIDERLPLGQLEPTTFHICQSALFDEWAAALEFVARTVRETMLGRVVATIAFEPEVVYDDEDEDGVSRPIGQIDRYRACVEGTPLIGVNR